MQNQGFEICLLGNNFIQYRKEMTKIASQLFYLALSKINPHIKLSKIYDKEFVMINIPTREVMSALGKTDVNNFTNNIMTLKTVAKKMQSLTIDNPYVEDDDFQILNVFSSISFNRKNGLNVEFNYHMTPFLLELSDKPYTQILLNDVCQLNSANSIRLLEIITLYAHNNAGKREITTIFTVDEFKRLMYMENHKSEYKVIKRDVLKPCIQEINNIGNYHIEMSEEKEGRKVNRLIFRITLPTAIYKFAKDKTGKQIAHVQSSEPSPEQIIESIREPLNTIDEPTTEWHPKAVNQVSKQENQRQNTVQETQKNLMKNMFADIDDNKLNDDILAAKLNSLGYAEANTRYWLEQNREKFLWAVAKTDEAAKKGKVKSCGAYLTAMLKQDVSFNNALVQAQAETYRKEKAECQAAEQEKYYREQDRKRIEKMADNSKKTVEELESSIALWDEFIIGKDQNSPVVLTVLKKLKEYRAELASRGL